MIFNVPPRWTSDFSEAPSGVRLKNINAGVSELADETDSKSVIRKGVWVRVPPPAPCEETLLFEQFSRKAEFLLFISFAIPRGFRTV